MTINIEFEKIWIKLELLQTKLTIFENASKFADFFTKVAEKSYKKGLKNKIDVLESKTKQLSVKNKFESKKFEIYKVDSKMFSSYNTILWTIKLFKQSLFIVSLLHKFRLVLKVVVM